MQHKTAWLEEQLAEELGTTIDVLHRKIGFWVKHGVLLESRTLQGKNLYTRTQQLNTGDAGDGSVPIAMEEDDGESALLSQEEQLKQVSSTQNPLDVQWAHPLKALQQMLKYIKNPLSTMLCILQ